MLKKILGILPLLLLLQASVAHSEEAAHKVGFVNVPVIMKNSPQVEAIEEGLKQEYDTRNAILESRREELKQLETQLKDAAALSFEDRSALERKILTERRLIKQSNDELAEDIAFRKADEMNRLNVLIFEQIEAIAKEQGLDMVFEGAVVFASERADISKQVLERLKTAFEASKSTPDGQ